MTVLSMSVDPGSTQEWLEPDGLGGFASGVVSGARSRRYHALLLSATTPPTDRFVLVNGIDAWVETSAGRFDLSSQWYSPGVLGGDGAQHIESFSLEPWPTWIFKFSDNTRLRQEIFVVNGVPVTCIAWRLLSGDNIAKLMVRPFLSGRDYHALHHCNSAFRFEAEVSAGRVAWQPYADVPGITAFTNGEYVPESHWYYNFLYEAEKARGLDCEEDLAAPGVFSWHLGTAEAALVFSTTAHADVALRQAEAVDVLKRSRQNERDRRSKFPSRLHRAADAYVVRRLPKKEMAGTTVIAGYPWFTDWGRDTFIGLRGLCIATGQLDTAREILISWAATVSEGMVPNRFPDRGEEPEFNSVDASLWFVNAVREYLDARSSRKHEAFTNNDDEVFRVAVTKILEGYSNGTRFGIRLAADGLLAAGEQGLQLTWMDAKVGDWVVTPRIGKPVEIQALWFNALAFGMRYDRRWQEPLDRGLQSFRERFWNPQRNCLFDVVDVNHLAGANDATLRPNQIFAVGGFPLALLDIGRARQVVDVVEKHLWTPAGLRSLGREEPGYTPRYEGNGRQRDGSYHQGTVWPWLMGAFVEAWLYANGDDDHARQSARRRFLEPLLAGMDADGLGHISEIADGDAPHTPRGCPFQAWSVVEALRLDRVVLSPFPAQNDGTHSSCQRVQRSYSIEPTTEGVQ
jgi:predicted glycogen debranching enzyme